MLNVEKCGLLVVDIQGQLARMVIDNGYMEQTAKLIQACRLLDIPIIWLEQYPKGLGSTIDEISRHLTGIEPIEKCSFGALAESDVKQAIKHSGKTQWLVCGIEAHICVYQSVLGLLEDDFIVEVVTDCVSSRSKANIDLALNKLSNLGAGLTSFEMAIYELVSRSDTPSFKKILPLIKEKRPTV